MTAKILFKTFLASLPVFAQQLPTLARQNIDVFYHGSPENSESAGRALASKARLTEALSVLYSREISRQMETSLSTTARARIRTRQAGESGASGGTTSLTSLAKAADLFSAAFESGALARQSEGTVTTFRVSGLGVYSLAAGYKRPCAISDPFCDTNSELSLRGLSGAVSIDNSKKETTATAAAQNANTGVSLLNLASSGARISSSSLRYEFLRRTAIEDNTVKQWRESLRGAEPSASELTLAIQGTMDDIGKSEELSANFGALQSAVRALVARRPGQAEFEQQYLDLLAEFNRLNAARFRNLGGIAAATQQFYSSLDNALHALLFQPAVTLEYVYSAPSAQQSFSGVRLIADTKKLLGANKNGVDPNLTGTVNIAVNWYNELPQGVKSGRMRDAQVSAQVDRALGSPERKVRSTVSLAGYYQYQVNPAILKFDQNALTPGSSAIPLPKPAAAVLDTKGSIAIVQGKLTIRLTDAISIPLAVSWANRTELIKASTVKGQFGLNLIFDGLFK